ncbi:hypothetical protein [Bacillus sp. FJAT-27986]|uniref:hypothetical protein n=1 Tax=Bacillus sp. FJAT-27986 TaxID=1743146 RepID=UPI001585B08F|nr:hypothetical protein [Bacillus sp. FJAT-27986]
MILLKHLWYEYKLKRLINKADSCTNPDMKKDLNKKINDLHLKLNEIEKFYISGEQSNG